MEHLRQIQTLLKAIIGTFTDPENRKMAGATGFAGIFCSWNICSINVPDFLIKYALVIKIIGGLLSIAVMPPLGTFLDDVYKRKVRPWIFKDKHRY